MGFESPCPHQVVSYILVFRKGWNVAYFFSIRTVTGKIEWSTSTIDRMLNNEKYAGDVLMQKTYTPDFLTGRKEKNCGQEEMYLVENAHEPIIDREAFGRVQEMKGHIKKQSN